MCPHVLIGEVYAPQVRGPREVTDTVEDLVEADVIRDNIIRSVEQLLFFLRNKDRIADAG